MEGLLKDAVEIAQENKPTVILISHTGVIYSIDLLSGKIKWEHETRVKPYMGWHGFGVDEHLDIAGGDEYPHYVSSSDPTVIRCKTAKEMYKRIKGLCKQDPYINDSEDAPYYLNCSSGSRGTEDGQGMLLIKRTDWDISIDKRWSLSYSNFEVSEQGSKCLVLYSRTPETFIENCNKFGLLDVPEGCILSRIYNQSKNIRLEYPERSFLKNKGNISYLHGTFLDDPVFIKRVPKKDALKLIKVHEKFHHSDYVARLLFYECDDHYYYLAFEKFQDQNEGIGTLATFIENCADPSELTIVLRYVVRALMDLHARGVLHCNITPEHVLVRTTLYSDCDYVVKLCGLGNSRPWMSDNSSYYQLEREQFAQLILNFMTRGSHKYVTNEVPIDYEYIPLKRNKYENGMEAAGPVAADLVEKLIKPTIPISFSMVYDHLLFWSFSEPILFLRDASDEIFAKTLKGIEDVAQDVFQDDWGIIIEKTEDGRAWFKKMKEVLEETEEEVPEEEETEEMKEVYKNIRCKVQGSERRGGRRRGRRPKPVHGGRAGNKSGGNKAEHDKAKRPVYDTTLLRDLLRLIRNSINHPCGLYPGVNKITMWNYVSENFPTLVVVVYNHVMEFGEDTQVYKEYCNREK